MLFGENRNDLRTVFFTAWRKYQNQDNLEPIEQQIVEVILQHPEYHELLNHPEANLERDYLPEFGETNPFLHLALHLTVHEQLATNRPVGIVDIYQQLVAQVGDLHSAEHLMVDYIAESIWRMQRQGVPLSDSEYLQGLTRLIK